MKKRFLSLLMVFCMLITCMPTVWAGKNTTDEDEDESSTSSSYSFYEYEDAQYQKINLIQFEEPEDEEEENAVEVFIRDANGEPIAVDKDNLTWSGAEDEESGTITWVCSEESPYAITITCTEMPEETYIGTLIVTVGEDEEECQLKIRFLVSSNEDDEDSEDEDPSDDTDTTPEEPETPILTFWTNEDCEGEGYILGYSKHDERASLEIPRVEDSGKANSFAPLSKEDDGSWSAQNDRFYLVTVKNDPDMPRSDKDVYKSIIKNVTFSVTEKDKPANVPVDGTLATGNEKDYGWDMVSIETTPFTENDGVRWSIKANITFNEDSVYTKTDDGVQTLSGCTLELWFTRSFYADFELDLTEKEEDAYKEALSYINAVCRGNETKCENFIEKYISEEDEALEDYFDMQKSAIVIQLPAGKFDGDIEITNKGLSHQVELRGVKDDSSTQEVEETVINGSVRALVNGEQQLELYDLHFVGKGKSEETYTVESEDKEDDAEVYGNYGITGPGEVVHGGCTFENFWAGIYANYPEQEYEKLHRRYDNVGSNNESFINNYFGIYFVGDTCTANGGADVIVSDAVFQDNDCAVYIESLYSADEEVPYYMYGVEYSKFLGNGVDIVYADSPLIFCPRNFYGDADGVRRAPRVLASFNVALAADAESTEPANISVAPMYASTDMNEDELIVDMNETTSFKMENDKAEDLTFELKTAENTNLAIEMVEMDEDNNSATAVGTWNISTDTAETE